ncbi:MAG: hypothetical protein HKO57_11410, partial [Akkermansiaceae bacterium]|nr:hypothetical protein [Akkermansiaceae bacterium]
VYTRVRRTGANRWLVSNEGRLTTFRIPVEMGFPDVAASTNVTGFNDHGGERYIHTNGAPAAEIVILPEPRRHLRLQSSESQITFGALAPDRCEFTTRGLRPGKVVLGGAAPASRWTLTAAPADAPKEAVVTTLEADAAGTISLTLPNSAVASLAPAAAAN